MVVHLQRQYRTGFDRQALDLIAMPVIDAVIRTPRPEDFAVQAGLFAVLPLIFLGDGAEVWRWCSAAALVLWVALYATFVREAIGPLRQGDFSLAQFCSGLAITLLGFSLLASNVFSPSEASARRYALALVCMLVLAGGAFVLGAFVRRKSPPAA